MLYYVYFVTKVEYFFFENSSLLLPWSQRFFLIFLLDFSLLDSSQAEKNQEKPLGPG